MSNITISSELREQVRQAREAYLQLANLGTESKNQVLHAFCLLYTSDAADED